VCNWLLFAPYEIKNTNNKSVAFVFDSCPRSHRKIVCLSVFTFIHLIVVWSSQWIAMHFEILHLQFMSLGMTLLFTTSWVNHYPHTQPERLKQIVALLNMGLTWEMKNCTKNRCNNFSSSGKK